jgi:hypothetical protein
MIWLDEYELVRFHLMRERILLMLVEVLLDLGIP